jgi:hypothetical protein
MAFATTPFATLTDEQHATELRKAVIAATVGTTIEWYDFFIYGTAAGLIFPALYFPKADHICAPVRLAQVRRRAQFRAPAPTQARSLASMTLTSLPTDCLAKIMDTRRTRAFRQLAN